MPSMGRAREVIKWFREHHKGMELIEAVREQDVEKVKVRRPLEAVSSTEHGPSRGVWGSVSGPSMPSSHARFGLAVSNLPLCRQAPLRQF